MHPVSIYIKEGDFNVNALSCSAIGIGPIYYRWEKYHLPNNSWISPSNRAMSSSITTQNLKFSNITEEDEGDYRCVVTNDDGSVTSDNATIYVYGECSVNILHKCDITCIMYRSSCY